MTSRAPKRDFLFIDESGDLGWEPGCSTYFVLGCLHVTDISMEELHRHYCGLGYFKTNLRELKSSRLSRLQKDQIADILKWLQDNGHAKMSAVIINKTDYTGPYLKSDGGVAANPIHFRNFINRQLLERHFINHPPITREYEVIFDYIFAKDEQPGLRTYLRGNLLLPYLKAIVQCDSRYVPALQFVDTMVHIVKETHFGKPETVDGRLLDAISVFDLTHPQKTARSI